MQKMLTRRQVLGGLGQSLVLAAGVGLGSGCKPPAKVPLVKAGMYQNTPEDLARLWSAILLACQRDDRNQVHELMESLILTEPELRGLIGVPKATELWARYRAMMGSLVNAGAVELVAHVYEKKYDDVAVTRIDTVAAPELVDTDQAVKSALVQPVPFYTVRVKRKSEAKGLRYDFFVYQNGFWRTGNLLGKFLLPPPPLGK
jgi:hypothetical protein